jgi:hypothetical protein
LHLTSRAINAKVTDLKVAKAQITGKESVPNIARKSVRYY